jgi:hypothetical protein
VAFFEYDFVGRHSLMRGDEFRRSFRWSVGGVPVDLTGWSGAVRFCRPGEDVAFTTSPLALGADGTIAWAVGPADTAAFPRGDVCYFATLTDSLGVVQTRMCGKVRVL